MTSTGLRGVVGEFDLFPLVRVEIKGVKIVESDSGVVDTSVTSENVNLIVDYGSS